MTKAFKLILFSLHCFFLFELGFSQINVPNVRSYNQAIYSIFTKTDTVLNYKSTHLSLKPIHDSKTNSSLIFQNHGTYKSWFARKLLKEHLLIFEGKDFWCSVDPVIDLEIGNERSNGVESIRFWNTRGIRVQAKFFKNFGFETSIYENQASLLSFQEEYVLAHGEFIVSNGKYNQSNAIIPSYARTKPFGDDGFDFAFAKGYFSYQPINWLNIEAGNGNHFIGHGYRSILLSDFTVNYPYLKPDLLLFNGRLQYSLIYASQQNQYRLPFHLTPEANYEKKLSVSHYIEFSINRNFQIGIFENNIWVTTDSLGTTPFNAALLNPLIGNSLFTDNKNYNAIGGVNASLKLNTTLLYGQLLFDQNTISGGQIGMRLFDLFIPQLNAQIEYNRIANQAYLNINKRANYNHANLPLAHPYGNNFQELVGILDYQYKRWYLINTSIYSERFVATDNLNGTLLLPIQEKTSYIANNVWYNKLEVGYRFNKKNNFSLNIGYINRISTVKNNPTSTNFAYFGIKTDLHQKTLDW